MKSAYEMAIHREKNKARLLKKNTRLVFEFLKRYEDKIEKSILNQGRYLEVFSTHELGFDLLQGLHSHLKDLGYVVEYHSGRSEDSIALSITLP